MSSQQDNQVSGAVLADLAAAARSVPHVTAAVAVLRSEAAREAAGTGSAGSGGNQAKRRPLSPRRPRLARAKPPAELSGGAVQQLPGVPMTLQAALLNAAADAPDKGTIYLTKDGAQFQSYAELLDEAQRLLGGLRAVGLRPGDSAVFQFGDNRSYITAFWACVLGGVVPTPVPLAPSYDRHSAVSRKLYNAWQLLGRPAILTNSAAFPEVSRLGMLWDEAGVPVFDVGDLAGTGGAADVHQALGSDPVLHLLTSGSTGMPKCVRHTNASVAARTHGVASACGYGPDDVTMNWMPLDHVSIAMYNVRDVFLKIMHVNAPVDMFMRDPIHWLDWIDRYRATNTWAPNFAFALINERAADVGRASWDLSCMRRMTNAAEPIINSTAHRFLEVLAPHGLPADAMRPCWGMSETCSGVTYSCLDRTDPVAGAVAVAASSMTGEIREAGPDDDAILFTDVGQPVPGLSLRIVGQDSEVLTEDQVGELQVRGEVMMSEYYGNEAANAEAFTADGWFRTGDLAFVSNGALVITGRHKDQIIIRGINYIAHEIEATVEKEPGVEVAYVAAAAIPDDQLGSDRLALFFVPSDAAPDAVRLTVRAIRARLVREFGISADFVVPLARNEFPKTSSGKIQRGQLAAELRAGTYDDRLNGIEDRAVEAPAESPWFFTRTWSPTPAPADRAAVPGTWLVFDENGWWDEAMGRLAP